MLIGACSLPTESNIREKIAPPLWFDVAKLVDSFLPRPPTPMKAGCPDSETFPPGQAAQSLTDHHFVNGGTGRHWRVQLCRS